MLGRLSPPYMLPFKIPNRKVYLLMIDNLVVQCRISIMEALSTDAVMIYILYERLRNEMGI